jgi:hypothetical protein
VHEFKYWPVLTFPDVRDERGEARPDIAGGLRFKTANTAPTTIVNFLNAQVGQEITILVDDDNTRFRHSPNLGLQGSMDFAGSKGNIITLIKMGTGFKEKSRSLTGV